MYPNSQILRLKLWALEQKSAVHYVFTSFPAGLSNPDADLSDDLSRFSLSKIRKQEDVYTPWNIR